MKRNYLFLLLVLAGITTLVGCGDPKVTGKVLFSDGSPVPYGQILFQKEGFIGSGEIQPDGSYNAGKLKDGDGLPPGTYQVFLSGTSAFAEVKQPQKESQIGQRPNFVIAPSKQLVHHKYLSASTSGLTVEVTGRTKYDVTVEKGAD